ncbi:MAG: LEPR-XLL domain-containing protein, partial [Gammaproteobacteria bacterium]
MLVEALEQRLLLDGGPQRAVQPQRDIGVLGGVGAG